MCPGSLFPPSKRRSAEPNLEEQTGVWPSIRGFREENPSRKQELQRPVMPTQMTSTRRCERRESWKIAKELNSRKIEGGVRPRCNWRLTRPAQRETLHCKPCPRPKILVSVIRMHLVQLSKRRLL